MRFWKELRTNWMYWRFRYITRNRLRLQAWWIHRRPQNRAYRSQPPGTPPYSGFRPRGTATAVYRRSPRRAWGILLGMVLALTALSTWATSTYVSPTVVYGLGAVIVVGAVYLALRGM